MTASLRSLFAAGISLVLLLAAVPVLTQKKFDPSGVLPRGCKAGALQCFGMVVAKRSKAESIPKDPASFVRHRGLPARADLSAFLPPVGNQGRQGSCTAWATTYYVKTLQENKERKWNLNAGGSPDARCVRGASRVFSPAWTYNQINGGSDGGSAIIHAFELLVNLGAAPCSFMSYNVNDFQTQPNREVKRQAAQFRSRAVTRVECQDHNAIKAVLAKGDPLVGGFKVTDDMYQLGPSGVWDSFDGDVKGGHAMAVVGYDDNKRSARGNLGAFKFVNSWGTEYGDQGFGWISYENFNNVCQDLYVGYDKIGGENDPVPGEEPTPPPVTSLSPPKQITASTNYSGYVIVVWDVVRGAHAYSVERSEPGSDSFAHIAFSDSSQYKDTAAQAGVTYRYRVAAIAGEIRSNAEDSPIAEGSASGGGGGGGGGGVPPKVVGLQGSAEASGGRARVRLSWSAAAGASYYAVARYDSSAEDWKILTSRHTGTEYADSSAPTGTNHYAVLAGNNFGRSEWSDAVEVSTGGGGSPSAAASVSASQGTFKDRIELSWSAVPGATGYFVVRYDPRKEDWEPAARITGTSWTDTSSLARSGQWVNYSIVPYTGTVTGDPSEPVQGRANPNAERGNTLPPPKGLSILKRTGLRVSLRWQAVPGAAEYYLFRRADREKAFRFVKASKSTSLDDELPEKGRLFFYAVRAKSALGGESENSGLVAAFENQPVQSVRHRFLPGEGLQEFHGRWKAVLLTERAAEPLEVRVSSSADRFQVAFSRNGRVAKTLQGAYPAKSKSLRTGGFTMTLISARSALVEVSDRSVHPERIRMVFARQ